MYNVCLIAQKEKKYECGGRNETSGVFLFEEGDSRNRIDLNCEKELIELFKKSLFEL